MSKQIQAIRGMNDLLPSESPFWQWLEGCLYQLMRRYAYREIRLPILEKTELFSRSIGEVTDIVEKEMYTFVDRNGDSLTLRPEGTAGCVRAGIEHGLFHNQTQRLWYMGPMFRHERPQKGRYRQFHQIGVEAFGLPGPDVDAEQILMTRRLWAELGLTGVCLELNSLGSPEARGRYREALVMYLRQYESDLDDDSRRRLHSNPLRVLDTKEPKTREILADAPKLVDYWDDESRAHFDGLCDQLNAAGVEYTINSDLVRGLDYYGKTVFEWITSDLGAQGTICAGGRYDGLVAQIGGRPTPAVGFAIGLERLVALLARAGIQAPDAVPDAYLVAVGEAAERMAVALAERLRGAVPALALEVNCGGGGFKAQMRRADRSGAAAALILGDEETRSGTIGMKRLREEGEQKMLEEGQLAEELRMLVAGRGERI